jgi:hypothetical protein
LGLYFAAWLLVAAIAAGVVAKFATRGTVRRVALVVVIGLTLWLLIWLITYMRFQMVEQYLLAHVTEGMTLEETELALRRDRLDPHYGYGGTEFSGILAASLWPALRPGFLHFDPGIHVQFESRDGIQRVRRVFIDRGPWLIPP